ncbi:hypothetical protein ACHAW5_001512 [Stephanodiscus triporus]|uniref:Chitin-binding type-1 domain-containing protein n=1 Tax=Stephanodiscus triporus TaxID=2934178 RepID=A0ABD3NHW1_9STRA
MSQRRSSSRYSRRCRRRRPPLSWSMRNHRRRRRRARLARREGASTRPTGPTCTATIARSTRRVRTGARVGAASGGGTWASRTTTAAFAGRGRIMRPSSKSIPGTAASTRGNAYAPTGCCSKFGWCGLTPAHCDGTTLPPTITTPPNPPSSSPDETLSPTTTTSSASPTPSFSTLAVVPTPPSPSPSPTSLPEPTPLPETLSPTTASPTSYLYSVADWENLSYSIELDWTMLIPGHTKFCGPKLVGGYEKATAMCSPLTQCGFAKEETHYGSTGNDCPEGLMCFGGITCESPSSSPSASPTATTTPSAGPTTSVPPTYVGQTRPPTYSPTTSNRPTLPPDALVDAMTSRGSYCGDEYDDAVSNCLPSTACVDDDDCNGYGAVDGWGSKRCFADISCYVDVREQDDMGFHELNSESEPDVGNNGRRRGIGRYGEMMAVVYAFLAVLLM